MDVDIFELPGEQTAGIKTVHGRLEKVLDKLEIYHDYCWRVVCSPRE